jgi:hypothetical protein
VVTVVVVKRPSSRRWALRKVKSVITSAKDTDFVVTFNQWMHDVSIRVFLPIARPVAHEDNLKICSAANTLGSLIRGV